MRGEHQPRLAQIQEPPAEAARNDDIARLRPTSGPQRDLVRTVLAILFIGGLIATSFWILWPFLPATLWATALVVATWPIMLQVQRRLWNRRGLAVAVMTLALLLVFVAPFWLAVATIAQNFDTLVGWTQAIVAFRLPPPPAWLTDLPMFGSQIIAVWQKVEASGIDELAAKAAPYAGGMAGWFVGALGGLSITIVQLLLTLVIAAVLYAGGDRAEAIVERFGHRLAGVRGRESVRLAGQAIRSVALGVVVTALVQAIMTGAGLAMAGVPLATVLTAVTFMLCIAQLGAGLVLIPAIVWLFWSGHPGWGTFLVVWTIIVISLDNIVRPLLMRKAVHLPLVLLLAGVIGGLIAFGLVGIFLGPVVLAVAYTLLLAWLDEDPDPDGGPAPPGLAE
ncbi:MAG: AI-2E family transporter YdiK [Alphaproteobacteria bacterium]|nr:AI-2E family transporter YdiK [Alphaproteobacteria bacterium]